MKISRMALAYLAFALLLGSLMPIMLKVFSGTSLYECLFLSSAVALPVSFLLIAAKGKAGRLASSLANPKELAFMALLGILNYGILELGLTYAERFLSASLATVLYRTFPLLVMPLAVLILRERATKYQLVALLLGFIGVYIAATGGTLVSLAGANLPIMAIVVAIALSSALCAVLIKKYSFDMDIAIFIFNASVFLLFGAAFALSGARFVPLGTYAVAAILYVGAVYNVLVGVMYYGALRKMKTSIFTNAYFLSPFLTFVFSWLLLGERIRAYYLAIAMLVSVGILIQMFDRRGSAYVSKSGNTSFHDVTSAFVNTDSQKIYDIIKSGGRVLAVPVEEYRCESLISSAGGSCSTFIYSSADREHTTKDQEEFIREITGMDKGSAALMSAGPPDAGESDLAGILGSAK